MLHLRCLATLGLLLAACGGTVATSAGDAGTCAETSSPTPDGGPCPTACARLQADGCIAPGAAQRGACVTLCEAGMVNAACVLAQGGPACGLRCCEQASNAAPGLCQNDGQCPAGDKCAPGVREDAGCAGVGAPGACTCVPVEGSCLPEDAGAEAATDAPAPLDAGPCFVTTLPPDGVHCPDSSWCEAGMVCAPGRAADAGVCESLADPRHGNCACVPPAEACTP